MGGYPGYDRFGRLIRQMWVDGAFQPYDSQNSLHNETDKPHVPPIVDLTYAYDKASNRTERFDHNPATIWPFRHDEFEYDGLHRLKDARRGVRDGQNFTHSTSGTERSRKWELDALGNWDTLMQWAASSYVTTETRDHSDANELKKRTIGSTDLDQTHDRAGNMVTQQIFSGHSLVTIRYAYDEWNRLVKAKYAPRIARSTCIMASTGGS